MNNNFGLSQVEFEEMVNDLKKNKTQIFEQIFLNHFDDCLMYLKKFRGASHQDAYDASMDTLLEFRRRLVEGKLKYGNLRFLFTRMAVQIYQKNLKHFLPETDTIPHSLVETPIDQEVLEQLNEAWKELGAACQQLLTWHYYGKMKLKEIAEQEQKSALAIRKQKERCLKKLKAVFEKKKEFE